MNTLNISTFKRMLQNGTNNLNNSKEHINSLNVFPVPDGDTGTNMSLTFTSGNKNAQLENSDSIATVAKSLSRGLLMGARGNSGVILSQIFRGFAQGLEEIDEATVLDVAKAFLRGSEVAYKAVMKPVEGTILTVIRESSNDTYKYLEENPDISMLDYFEKLIELAHISLENTPNLLPVLKEVGVVDSGGAGLVLILEGFLKALLNETIDAMDPSEIATTTALTSASEEFGYCTETILRLSDEGLIHFSEEKMKAALARLGDSIVLVKDDDLVKIHVHTLTPGVVLNMAQLYGELVTIKIDNMQEQHDEIVHNTLSLDSEKTKENYALVAVAAGEGLAEYFKSLRVDVVISGGQTMNPSTEDFIEKIKNINAENIIILPNNSNIILAAQQVKDILEDKNIHIVPSKTIIQGISACVNFNPDVDVESNLEHMNSALEYIKTGEVTYAIKDTQYKGIEIKANDFMGIANGEIVVSDKDLLASTKTLIDNLVTDDDELLTLVVGEDATLDDQEAIIEYVEDKYDLEIELIDSKQPIYYFVIGVE